MHQFGIWVATMLVAISTANLAAADKTLVPPCVVSEQTITLAYIDVSVITADDLRNSLQAILGEHAATFDKQLKHLQTLRDEFVAAGGKALAVAINLAPAGSYNGSALIVMPSTDANLTKLQTWFNGQLADQQKLAVQWITRDGQLLLLASGEQPPAPSQPRYAQLSERFEAIQSPIKLLYAPFDQSPPMAEKLFLAQGNSTKLPPIVSSILCFHRPWLPVRYLVIGGTCGEKPQINATMDGYPMEYELPGDDLFQGTLHVIASTINPTREDPGILYERIPRNLHKNGTTLSTTLDTPTLAIIAKPVVTILVAAAQPKPKPTGTALEGNMRQLVAGIIRYADQHNNEFPDQLDQVADYIGGPEQFKKLMIHPISGANPGYVYVKPNENVGRHFNYQKTVLLYEIGADGKPKLDGARAFPDCRVESPLVH